MESKLEAVRAPESNVYQVPSNYQPGEFDLRLACDTPTTGASFVWLVIAEMKKRRLKKSEALEGSRHTFRLSMSTPINT